MPPQPNQNQPQIPAQKPIIYQNGTPNFENQPNRSDDKNFFRTVIELDLGLHLLVFIAILVIGGVIWFSSSKSKPATPSNQAQQPRPNQSQ